MNSCLYRCRVMHDRLEPVEHRFVYSLFLFCIDLDELDTLRAKLKLFSRNRFNLFSFYDNDHMEDSPDGIRAKLERYLRENGVDLAGGKILLLTHVRTFGYVFNPVSFYFCYRPDGTPACVVAEVGNTFGEIKPFFIGPGKFQDPVFQSSETKHFYVSPFIDLDARFQFRLRVPGEQLDLRIDDFKQGKRFFLSSLTGVRRALTDGALAWYSLRFPLVTLKVIAAIYWQALRLYLKKLPFHRKHSHPGSQQGVYRGTSHF